MKKEKRYHINKTRPTKYRCNITYVFGTGVYRLAFLIGRSRINPHLWYEKHPNLVKGYLYTDSLDLILIFSTNWMTKNKGSKNPKGRLSISRLEAHSLGLKLNHHSK